MDALPFLPRTVGIAVLCFNFAGAVRFEFGNVDVGNDDTLDSDMDLWGKSLMGGGEAAVGKTDWQRVDHAHAHSLAEHSSMMLSNTTHTSATEAGETAHANSSRVSAAVEQASTDATAQAEVAGRAEAEVAEYAKRGTEAYDIALAQAAAARSATEKAQLAANETMDAKSAVFAEAMAAHEADAEARLAANRAGKMQAQLAIEVVAAQEAKRRAKAQLSRMDAMEAEVNSARIKAERDAAAATMRGRAAVIVAQHAVATATAQKRAMDAILHSAIERMTAEEMDNSQAEMDSVSEKVDLLARAMSESDEGFPLVFERGNEDASRLSSKDPFTTHDSKGRLSRPFAMLEEAQELQTPNQLHGGPLQQKAFMADDQEQQQQSGNVAVWQLGQPSEESASDTQGSRDQQGQLQWKPPFQDERLNLVKPFQDEQLGQYQEFQPTESEPDLQDQRGQKQQKLHQADAGQLFQERAQKDDTRMVSQQLFQQQDQEQDQQQTTLQGDAVLEEQSVSRSIEASRHEKPNVFAAGVYGTFLQLEAEETVIESDAAEQMKSTQRPLRAAQDEVDAASREHLAAVEQARATTLASQSAHMWVASAEDQLLQAKLQVRAARTVAAQTDASQPVQNSLLEQLAVEGGVVAAISQKVDGDGESRQSLLETRGVKAVGNSSQSLLSAREADQRSNQSSGADHAVKRELDSISFSDEVHTAADGADAEQVFDATGHARDGDDMDGAREVSASSVLAAQEISQARVWNSEVAEIMAKKRLDLAKAKFEAAEARSRIAQAAAANASAETYSLIAASEEKLLLAVKGRTAAEKDVAEAIVQEAIARKAAHDEVQRVGNVKAQQLAAAEARAKAADDAESMALESINFSRSKLIEVAKRTRRKIDSGNSMAQAMIEAAEAREVAAETEVKEAKRAQLKAEEMARDADHVRVMASDKLAAARVRLEQVAERAAVAAKAVASARAQTASLKQAAEETVAKSNETVSILHAREVQEREQAELAETEEADEKSRAIREAAVARAEFGKKLESVQAEVRKAAEAEAAEGAAAARQQVIAATQQAHAKHALKELAEARSAAKKSEEARRVASAEADAAMAAAARASRAAEAAAKDASEAVEKATTGATITGEVAAARSAVGSTKTSHVDESAKMVLESVLDAIQSFSDPGLQ
eukprot:TRINITY_DN54809_c0_g1_i1.p1 TRINITY_DN54809_c0_g1~~TRINITY_DN54809_c0_g1_i1.p1  ORF type:complete len:1185 (+),score=304.49 TRINITY_DN54809_c0_g1_i1:58-3555(+)